MTVNPMQRRTRNSFLLGFGVAMLVSIVIIVALVFFLGKVRKDLKDERAKQKNVLVAATDISEYSEVKYSTKPGEVANVVPANTVLLINEAELVTFNDLETTDEVKILSKMKIPKGTIITKSMLISDSEKDAHDLRLYELNMIMIPSELKQGDVVDIRLALPTGEDFIVVAKKVVEKADAMSIWIKMTEDEILVFNNAMVEAYLIQGAKLYAVPYVHPGIQKVAVQTYPLSDAAWKLISVDSNITEKARLVLTDKHNKTAPTVRKAINDAKIKAMQENGLDRVYEAVEKEISDMNKKREEYIEKLTEISY